MICKECGGETKPKPIKEGICEDCRSEYEGNPPIVPLYSFRGGEICGGCVNQIVGDDSQAEDMYGIE